MSVAKNRAQVPAFTGCHCMRLRGERLRVCGRGAVADDAEVVRRCAVAVRTTRRSSLPESAGLREWRRHGVRLLCF